MIWTLTNRERKSPAQINAAFRGMAECLLPDHVFRKHHHGSLKADRNAYVFSGMNFARRTNLYLFYIINKKESTGSI